MDDELTATILEWLSGERKPQPRWKVQSELARLGRSTTIWPRATQEEWSTVIDKALKQGAVLEQNGNLRLPTEKPAKDKQQLDLF